MVYNITYGEFQNYLHEYYQRTGKRMRFIEMAEYLYQKGLLKTEGIRISTPDDYASLTNEEFDQLVDSFALEIIPDFHTGDQVIETDIFP